MGKTITLRRSELVWEIYETTWDEHYYKDFIEFVKKHAECEEQEENEKKVRWATNYYRVVYAMLSHLSWEEVVDIINGKRRDFVEYYIVGDDGTKIFHDLYAYDVIISNMREDCYNSVPDHEYADDYDEDIFVNSSSEDNNDENVD